MKHNISQKQIVIYGGGMAGAFIAKQLADKAQITLIDPNEYFEIPMAAPRNLVQPDFANQSIISFQQGLPNVKHIRGKLIELNPDGTGLVSLADGNNMKISADITVLATGHYFSNHLMRATSASVLERKAFYREYSPSIQQSRNILIVGGGPIGVEVAGEISENYPEKNIVIVESNHRILSGTTAKASAFATQELTKRGVKIITKDKNCTNEQCCTRNFCCLWRSNYFIGAKNCL